MSEDAKPQVTSEEKEVNEHGVAVGVDLDFSDVLRMQRAIWAAGQPAAAEEDAEVAQVKKPAKAKK